MSSHDSKEIENRVRLFKAAESGAVQVLHQLLNRSQLPGDYSNNDLRIALHKAAQAGIEEAVQVLLDKGVKIDVSFEKGLPLLHRAAIKGHTRIIKLLLKYGADPDIRDQSGRTAYTCAALGGQNSVLAFLQAHHIDINAVDQDNRTALHALAADAKNPSKWNHETVQILLQGCPDLDMADKLGRTALHWAAATGKLMVASQILNISAEKAETRARATTNRGKTALHLAAVNNHVAMVRLLMRNGALIEETSEGNWTALLNAAKNGHIDTVDMLLDSGANVNARTSIGMTALHWAAELGHLEIVRRILKEPKAWKNSKDNFDSTPLMRAGQHGHHEIIQALRPHLFGSLSLDAGEACARFTASVVDFYCDVKALRRCIVKKKSVYETLYAIDPNDISKERFTITTLIEDIQPNPPDFRWIHLPSNNVAWAEALITKFFLEKGLKGATDAAGFKAMIRILAQQQHRGPGVYSRYMRPGCRRVSDGESQTGPRRRPKSRNLSPAKANEPLVPSLLVNSQQTVYKDIIILFMPYLHWETDYNRVQATQAIKRHQNQPDYRLRPITTVAKDEFLIRGYLNSTADLHLRRTLDQFKYRSINTEKHDRDQVILRYCQREKKDLKIFMVDQMWIWILGDNLVFTSFPDRWGQPKEDPLNLFDGLIEDINSKSKSPFGSVFELATLITDRCTGTFDRHHRRDRDYRFLEMFELSVGTATRRQTALFQRYKRDSTAAAHWLKTRDRGSNFYAESTMEQDAADSENEEDDFLQEEDDDDEVVGPNKLVDRLLNIAPEANLIVECKDIQDEIGILATVLRQQKSVLSDMERTVFKFAGGFLDDTRRQELTAKVSRQQQSIDLSLTELQRMDRQLEDVNTNLAPLLDLKSKHANALEARFQRDQAQATTRQGQIIMIFTIVTIIFLPMSFMASFFAINIIDLPHDSSNGGSGLPLAYVAKYMFGIGFAVSIPLIFIAFLITDMESWIQRVKRKMGFSTKRKKTKSRLGAPTSPGREQISEKNAMIEEPRMSVDWSIGRIRRWDTDNTNRSRITLDLERG